MKNKKLRVALIYPNRYAKYNLRDSPLIRLPPLNLLTIAGLTPREYYIEIVDERYEKIDFTRDYDLVGITALTCNASRAYEIARRFHENGAKTVLGGIHPTIMPDEAKKYADSVVIGEAETSWQILLRDIQEGNLRPFYNEGLADLKETPVPRWDLLPNHTNYLGFVQTSRGCPNNCSFCIVPRLSGRKVRTKPIGKVIDEIKKIGKRMVVFVDDNILAKKYYAKELFKALRPLKIRWGSEASINLLEDPELIELSSQSGARAFYIGIETIRKKGLNCLNKTFNKIYDFKNVIKRLHRHGIAVIGSLMFGTDEDDPEVFVETLDFLDNVGIDGATFSILTPMPGTYLFEQFKKEGRIFTFDWSKYDALHTVYKPKRMSVEDLQKGLKKTYKKFYSFSRVIRRSLRSIKISPFLSYFNFALMKYGKGGLTPE